MTLGQFIATTRRSLRASACSSDGSDDEQALIAQTVRRVASARGTILRREVVATVAALLSPILEVSDLLTTIDDEIDALVDVGDLVLHRAADRTPRTVDLASGALVELGSNSGFLLLGRVEAALPAYVRKVVRIRNRLRWIPSEAIDEAVSEELRFQDCPIIAWRAWAEVPEEIAASLFLSRILERGTRFTGDGSSFASFDPKSDPWFYSGRFVTGMLMPTVERERWAAARSEGAFGQKMFSLFGFADGQLRRADVAPGEFTRVVAACATLGGGPLVARTSGDQFRLHFPPPWWLRRLMSVGVACDRNGALVGIEMPASMVGAVMNTLKKNLFCDVRTEQNGEWR